MKHTTTIKPSVTRKLPLLVALIASLIAIAPSGRADVIYAQNFGFSGATPGSGSYTNFASIGWSVLGTTTIGGNVTTNIHPYYASVFDFRGKPTNMSNVNAPLSASDQYGTITLRNLDNQKMTTLIYTDQYAINQSSWDLNTITWYSAGTSGGSSYEATRIALQINGLWYVSSPTNSLALSGNNPANFNTSASQRSLTVDSANWYELTANTGSPFAISGTATALPTNTITAFGFYATPDIDGSHGNSRYLMLDSLVINATVVPEPSSLALMAFGLAAALWLRKSRK